MSAGDRPAETEQRMKMCRNGGHRLDRRTEKAGGELCFACATGTTAAEKLAEIVSLLKDKRGRWRPRAKLTLRKTLRETLNAEKNTPQDERIMNKRSMGLS